MLTSNNRATIENGHDEKLIYMFGRPESYKPLGSGGTDGSSPSARPLAADPDSLIKLPWLKNQMDRLHLTPFRRAEH